MAPLADDAYVCAGDVEGNLLCWNVQTMETKWESTMQVMLIHTGLSGFV